MRERLALRRMLAALLRKTSGWSIVTDLTDMPFDLSRRLFFSPGLFFPLGYL
jgi:hypothetical protein